MNSYRIEWLIETVSKNAILEKGKSVPFVLENVRFEHWNYSVSEAWVGNRWIASSIVEADNLIGAINILYHKLGKIIPRLSLVGQCYVDFVNQPYSVHKEGADLAYFFNTYEGTDSGLMFRENELDALKQLLKKKIPAEFFLYWNDIVNTIGYSSKLSLMCAAIEALVKKKDGNKNWKKLERILGKKVKKVLWGEPSNTSGALRNRLIHGEYFSSDDFDKNYVEVIHKKIICYFNNRVLRKKLINPNVKNPQRHILPYKKSKSQGFIKCKFSPASFGLKSLLKSINLDTNLLDGEKYEYIASSLVKEY